MPSPVADTGPLISYARADRLDLLRAVIPELILPPEVFAEATRSGPGGSARPGAEEIRRGKDSWVLVQAVADPTTLDQVDYDSGRDGTDYDQVSGSETLPTSTDVRSRPPRGALVRAKPGLQDDQARADEFLTQLPEEDFSREDLQYRLDLSFKFSNATQQLASGQFLTMEEVEENLANGSERP